MTLDDMLWVHDIAKELLDVEVGEQIQDSVSE